MTGIIGKKIGMTRLIQEDGKVVPMTVIECAPNQVTQVKTTEKDGYSALVIGCNPLKKPTKTKKFSTLKEFRIESDAETKQGDQVTVEIFEEGDAVSISGTSKGKGFQGVIKRHNFSRGPQSHGSHHNREPGSVGGCARPGKIFKGQKLPGQMGNNKVTISKTSIVYRDAQKNLIGIKGSVPGSNNSYITIKKLS
ncbi:50S ribosomal protein L3 [Candidatus Peregrinibacteria bacterium]|nr:50S ribosomal protein L3 [Candidatus Peregrinibacteria bacterium]